MDQASQPADRPGAAPLADLVGADLVVPLAQGGSARYVNLDIAASGQCLQVVKSRVDAVLPYYSSVHRGSGYLSTVSTSLYEQSREEVGRLAGAGPEDVVVFTRNTTDALNLLARCVPDGDVVCFDLEHHANLLPWQARAHRVLPTPGTVAELLQRLEDSLAERPAALVAVTAASNVTGEVLPVSQLSEIAHRHGARVAVDAAQLAPHRGVHLRRLGADYVAFSGHKCYAPFGGGALVGRRDWLDAADPYLRGGGAVIEVTVEETTWAPSPDRHEGGTPNLLGGVTLATAMAELDRIGVAAIERHDAALRRRLLDGIADLNGAAGSDWLTPLRAFEDGTDAIGVVTLSCGHEEAALVAAYLSCEWGIGVREGRFCAHPLLARLNAGKNALRVSTGIGTTLADIDRLIEALDSFAAKGPTLQYRLEQGFYEPTPDLRALAVPGLDLGLASATPCRR